MKKVIIGIAVVVLLVAIGLIVKGNKSQPITIDAPFSTPQASPQEQNIITLTTDGFSPATLTIQVGTKVTWMNKSGVNATVDSSSHPAHTSYPPLNLGIFPDGGTLSLTFDKAGTYKYHNHLSSSQTGTIVAQ